MQRPLHLIYIPGLGDAHLKGQRLLVKTWKYWGVESEVFQMNWADKKPWEPKYARLLSRIDALTQEGKEVALVGASAGASAAVNAFAARRESLKGCVLIAAKVNRPEAVGRTYRLTNPAFMTSVQAASLVLSTLTPSEKARILSRYALIDETVTREDSHIPGGYNQAVWTIGHGFTIGSQLLVGAPSFIAFLRGIASDKYSP